MKQCRYLSKANQAQSCDEQLAKTYRRWDSVFKHSPQLSEDLVQVFDKEAN